MRLPTCSPWCPSDAPLPHSLLRRVGRGDPAAGVVHRNGRCRLHDREHHHDAPSEYASPRPYLKMVSSWIDSEGTGMTPATDRFTATGELREIFKLMREFQQTVFGEE